MKMAYSNNIFNTNGARYPLPTSGFPFYFLPFNNPTTTFDKKVFDLDLYNLKQAYNVPLESSDRTPCYEEKGAEKRGYEEDEDEGDSDEIHPIQLCESQIAEDDCVGEISSSENEYKCCHCPFKGAITQLQNHTKYCHPCEFVRHNWCDLCKVGFEDQTVFKRHQKQEHMFYCSHCGKCFKRWRLLLAHLQTHSEANCFKCPTCEKEFPTQRYFIRHLERHEKRMDVKKAVEIEIYKCTMCQKDFTKKESLVKHVRIHTRESLKCSLCDFKCGKKVTLKMHVLSHEGNRKYKCKHCDFSFKQVGHLKRHIARFNH